MTESSRSAARATRDGEQDAVVVPEMQISIDSQSFVNLGQLMGSRHGIGPAAAGGSSASRAPADDLGASCLSDDSEGMHDFDQIFHPRAEQGGGSSSSAWSGRDLYGRRGGAADHDAADDDDNDSLLPALPSRSCTPGSPRGADLASYSNNKPTFPAGGEAGWAEEDFATTTVDDRTSEGGDGDGGRGQAWASPGALLVDVTNGGGMKVASATATATAVSTPETQRASLDTDYAAADGSAAARTVVVQAQPSSDVAAGGSSIAPPFLRDSWLHIPLEGGAAAAAGESESEGIIDTQPGAATAAAAGPGDASGIAPRQQRYHDAAEAAARARRAAAVALADCGGCLALAADKAASLAASPLQQLARAVKEQADAGAEACTRGQQAVIKAVDSVPQAPGERREREIYCRACDKGSPVPNSWRDPRVRYMCW